ncbi:glycosyltransferase family 2 protein [Shewanella pealeana]|uniref:Glycosyl transferase family 2 n=1 Tax=Shewanella pealeana (strain ATCC 700345 / ANG-SQ1) TaxID=398579 RepID=A8H2F0_SHEPA|nr:glycosyltransferase [Shewanella pealeana]ABV86737.1 glycosyl transferase family 2 [Shewanella pealeana ATCC 700345]
MRVNNRPLVSVVLLSYNSSSTILDTLNSVVNQSYGACNIELIISDDCSQDDSVIVISKWLESNKDSFFCCHTFFNKINLGVCANTNQAWASVSASWVKTIAADDILFKDSIKIFSTKACLVDSNVACIFSNVRRFREDVLFDSIDRTWLNSVFDKGASFVYRALLTKNFLDAPGSFIRYSALKSIGFVDVENRFVEDYPLWLRLSANGYSFQFIDNELVYYRVGNGVSTSTDALINKNILPEVREILIKSASNNLKKSDYLYWVVRFDCFITRIIMLLAQNLFDNKRSFISVNLLRLVKVFYIRPVFHMFKFWMVK